MLDLRLSEIPYNQKQCFNRQRLINIQNSTEKALTDLCVWVCVCLCVRVCVHRWMHWSGLEMVYVCCGVLIYFVAQLCCWHYLKQMHKKKQTIKEKCIFYALSVCTSSVSQVLLFFTLKWTRSFSSLIPKEMHMYIYLHITRTCSSACILDCFHLWISFVIPVDSVQNVFFVTSCHRCTFKSKIASMQVEMLYNVLRYFFCIRR